VKAVQRRESRCSRASYIVPLLVAISLLLIPDVPDHERLFARFLAPSLTSFCLGALLTLGGLAVSIWARVHLGRNWSGTVTIKQDHELIRSGPYARVRHPIYSGLLLAFAGSAIALGEWRGLLALSLVWVAYWRKLRIEERWMQETFGALYQRYRAQTGALIPYLF